MKREELEALGLTKEQSDKVLDMYHKELDPVQKDLETAQKDLENQKEKTSTQDTTINDLKEGIAAALKTLAEAEDSKRLFGEPEPDPVGTGNIIGLVQRSGSNTDDAALRAAMGLPPVQEQK